MKNFSKGVKVAISRASNLIAPKRTQGAEETANLASSIEINFYACRLVHFLGRNEATSKNIASLSITINSY